MTAPLLTLTAETVAYLRGHGDAYVQAGDTLVRLIRDGSGDSPVAGKDGILCPNQLVLSPADLDLIGSPDGLVCTSTDRAETWTVRVAS